MENPIVVLNNFFWFCETTGVNFDFLVSVSAEQANELRGVFLFGLLQFLVGIYCKIDAVPLLSMLVVDWVFSSPKDSEFDIMEFLLLFLEMTASCSDSVRSILTHGTNLLDVNLDLRGTWVTYKMNESSSAGSRDFMEEEFGF